MTPTPVGMRCPACARERTKVRKPRAIATGGIAASAPVATYTLIVVNALAFLAESSSGGSLTGGNGLGGTVFLKGALFGPDIATNHEYWRLVTAGFLHDGFQHIFFNMIFLYFVGPALEAVIGRLKFFVVYFVSLLAGSFGALLFEPHAFTVGASGACFGVLGALMVVMHDRRVSIWSSGLGIVLVINIVFSVAIPGISIGGHVGGFIGGAIVGWLLVELDEHRRMPAAALAASLLVAALSVAGAIAVASGTGLTPNGLRL
jgi:membrane associated rhomboid family serine protease